MHWTTNNPSNLFSKHNRNRKSRKDHVDILFNGTNTGHNAKGFHIILWILCPGILEQRIPTHISGNVFEFLFPHSIAYIQLRFINTYNSLRFPWNRQTPIGYVAALIMQYAWFIIGVFVIVSILLLFSGICTLFQTFVLDIKQSLQDLNDSMIGAQGRFTTTDRIILKQQLYNIMEFHSQAKL